jgi:hypothetical protein
VIREGCKDASTKSIRTFVETIEPGPRYPVGRAEAMAFYRSFAKENEMIRMRFFPDKTSLFEEDFSMYPEEFDIDAERMKYSASELLEQYKSSQRTLPKPVAALVRAARLAARNLWRWSHGRKARP